MKNLVLVVMMDEDHMLEHFVIFQVLMLNLEFFYVQLNDNADGLDFFKVLFGDDIVNLIVDQTNCYSRQPKLHKGRRSSQTDCIQGPFWNWTDATLEEIRAWIGMSILMGIQQLPDLDSYWSSDLALAVPPIAKVMPCKALQKDSGNTSFT